MKLVLVASTNPCKIDACRQAFTKIFPNDSFSFQSIAAPSNVSDQPFGEEETRQGSINRVMNAQQTWKEEHDEQPEFIVGLEGGVKEDTIPMCDKSVEKGLLLFAWMAIFEPRTNRWGFGRTGSFYIPFEVSKLVLNGTELGVADDQFFGKVNSGQSTGTVGILTNGLLPRGDYYEHALLLALIPFLHPELYPLVSNP